MRNLQERLEILVGWRGGRKMTVGCRSRSLRRGFPKLLVGIPRLWLRSYCIEHMKTQSES
jgi:hypothetical protein